MTKFNYCPFNVRELFSVEVKCKDRDLKMAYYKLTMACAELLRLIDSARVEASKGRAEKD